MIKLLQNLTAANFTTLEGCSCPVCDISVLSWEVCFFGDTCPLTQSLHQTFGSCNNPIQAYMLLNQKGRYLVRRNDTEKTLYLKSIIKKGDKVECRWTDDRSFASRIPEQFYYEFRPYLPQNYTLEQV